ncbi:fructose-bisphosphatase class III [Enterococcus caccae]|uniref:Fructose-1,6-bisphosphatase class 3 n=1 Tax=Enterococcus caccae ATCC BAA-1240 TaxID=1158612 RepID=R3W8K8_9ENTE|nr:fructose-bisphosphatase class III [Enterococcus caccae]EOL44181.1 fructose-1,6-bisphosphatase [Enterococcus caccae ATCC BAA-1240]EOT68703.1 fructose-1,6-bisphosphatase [Enterococcus caccae ATCC BAA-1240]OJG28081.1 fructose-1,6-bisphosphatase [Enterococcus caccae]
MSHIQSNELIAEIINLEAILNLPKGTEHFISDLHGEFDAFNHILRNGSGSIRDKVYTLFSQKLSAEQMDELCFLIYYPEEKLQTLKKQKILAQSWWFETIERLLIIVRFSSSKYTRSKVRKALPKTYAYILEELIYQYDETTDKKAYYRQIIHKIIDLGEAERFIADLAYLTQRFVIDHLHVIGDIYDRGPHPDKIMDSLMAYHSLDIQWGNHDIIWLGAVSGSKACLANVLRICARYGNLDLLENAYGIDLHQLKSFSRKTYQENNHFRPKQNPYRQLSLTEITDAMKIQQAMAIIQEKLEGQIIKRRPDFKMEHRLLLDKIQDDQIVIDYRTYTLINGCFQTVKQTDPYQLSAEESLVINDLMEQFQHSKKLKHHMAFLLEKGSLYLPYNHNLLIHGCIPLNEDGSFQSVVFADKEYAGKPLLDFFESTIKKAFAHPWQTEDFSTDIVWYLWCGESSSLFGKTAMKTFERYFIKESNTHIEVKNAYYKLRNNAKICQQILHSFALDQSDAHIINGHTPVKLIKGESPIKADGKMIVIDGGFSRAYQKVTGIAGYTLLYNSFGMQLAAHKPFSDKETAIKKNDDIVSTRQIVDRQTKRLQVKDTTIGMSLLQDTVQLKQQLENHIRFSSNEK